MNEKDYYLAGRDLVVRNPNGGDISKAYYLRLWSHPSKSFHVLLIVHLGIVYGLNPLISLLLSFCLNCDTPDVADQAELRGVLLGLLRQLEGQLVEVDAVRHPQSGRITAASLKRGCVDCVMLDIFSGITA